MASSLEHSKFDERLTAHVPPAIAAHPLALRGKGGDLADRVCGAVENAERLARLPAVGHDGDVGYADSHPGVVFQPSIVRAFPISSSRADAKGLVPSLCRGEIGCAVIVPW